MGSWERVTLQNLWLDCSRCRREGGQKLVFLWSLILCTVLFTSAFTDSMKLGWNTKVIIRMNCFVAKFLNFFVKGSLFPKQNLTPFADLSQ